MLPKLGMQHQRYDNGNCVKLASKLYVTCVFIKKRFTSSHPQRMLKGKKGQKLD